MFFLKFDVNNFVIKSLCNHRYKKKYYNDSTNVFFFGNFRTNIEIIDEIILSFKDKKFSNENILRIFEIIDGICTLVIINDDEVKVTCSIQNSWLKVFKIGSEFIVTENEKYQSNNLSADNSFLKLFSYHVYFFHYGLSSDVIDFICPGSVITFKKKLKNYEFSWYLDFEKFCSRDDHEQIANLIAENFLKVFDNFNNDFNYHVCLSGGIDSALVTAAANKKLDFKTLHEGRNVHSDELQTAKNVSRFFNKKIEVIYPFKKKYFLLDEKDDVTDYLNYSYSFIKKDSVYFFLDSSFVNVGQFYKKAYFFGGDAFPMELTLDHMMSYPRDRYNKKMGYEVNKERRYLYSLNFLKELKNKDPINDFWEFGKKFPTIHPYYYLILSMFIEQEPRFISNYINKNLKFEDIEAYSPINSLSFNQKNNLKIIKMKNAHKIISKIMISNFFKKNLQIPNERIAQILFKLVRYLGRTNKENHQAALTSSTNLPYEPIGLNSKIHLNLLYTKIDEKLVNFAKWHIFRAFEILTGKKFEDLYYSPSLKHPKYFLTRLNLKTQSKLKKLPEYNDTYALANNKSLHDFIKFNKVIDKYEEFKKNNEYKNLLYNFPTKEELKNLNNITSNFWKINHIVNIVNKIDV